jgi:competence ComEA-like helix-hairpin-helix protein
MAAAGWPRAAQRVLLVAGAGLLVFSLLASRREATTPAESAVPDDPSIDVRIDLNSASAADLEALPGIGTALASRIVAEREARGPFRGAEDLERVPGVGRRLAAQLRPLVTCGTAP